MNFAKWLKSFKQRLSSKDISPLTGALENALRLTAQKFCSRCNNRTNSSCSKKRVSNYYTFCLAVDSHLPYSTQFYFKFPPRHIGTCTNEPDNRKNSNETSYLTTPQHQLFSTGAKIFITFSRYSR